MNVTAGEVLSLKQKAGVSQPTGTSISFRSNGSCQPSGSEQCCSGATIDSGTPLLSQGSSDVSSESLIPCESRSLQSEGDGSATSSDATLMTDVNTGSTFVGSPNKVSGGKLLRLVFTFVQYCKIYHCFGHRMQLQIKQQHQFAECACYITRQCSSAWQYGRCSFLWKVVNLTLLILKTEHG